jgi:hypothetical protein
MKVRSLLHSFNWFSLLTNSTNKTNLTKAVTQFNEILIYPTSVPGFTESFFAFLYSGHAMVKVGLLIV